MRNLFSNTLCGVAEAVDDFVWLPSMLCAGCGRLVDELWKALWSVWSQTHNQIFCTIFVRSLWMKTSNFTHLFRSLYAQVYDNFSSVTRRLLPTIHTANNNYYF